MGHGTKLVRMGELFASGFVDCRVDDYALIDLTDDEKDRFLLEDEDLLFSRTSVVAAGVGKCCLVKNARGQEVVFDSNMIRFRLAKDVALPAFFYYYFNSPSGRSSVLSLSGGSAVTTVTGSGLSSLQVPLPPLPTQRKIAAILSAYDDLIENNNRRIKILEEMAKNLYHEWFVIHRFPGHENHEMVDSQLGEIPEGWEVKTVGELTSYHIGGGWGKDKPDDRHTVPAHVIRGTDIPNVARNIIDVVPYRFHTTSNLKSRILQPRDIVFEVSGGSKDQPVGRALLVTQQHLKQFDEQAMCASFCKLIRPDKSVILPELMYLHFEQIYDTRHIMQYQVQSTGITNLKFQHFLTMEALVVPKKNLQDSFAILVTPIYESIQMLGFTNANLHRTRNLLLPRLISGQLDISNIDVFVDE